MDTTDDMRTIGLPPPLASSVAASPGRFSAGQSAQIPLSACALPGAPSICLRETPCTAASGVSKVQPRCLTPSSRSTGEGGASAHADDLSMTTGRTSSWVEQNILRLQLFMKT